MVLFIGPNGTGKTNLVESLVYLSSLTSHRVSADASLVREGESEADIGCSVTADSRTVDIDITITASGSNSGRYNGHPVPRLRDLLGVLRLVVFAPEDIDIIRRDPGDRRRFLDDLLLQLQPGSAHTRSDYDRVVKQRNSLLKSLRGQVVPDAHSETLQAWNEQLVSAGSAIINERRQLIEALSGHVAAAYERLAQVRATVEVSYRSTIDDFSEDARSTEEAFTLALEAAQSKELERGMTMIGPHRDDVVIALNGMPARETASQGECWSLALALRLGAFALLRDDARGGGDPVLVLDDVFAQLDENRRSQLAKEIDSVEQVLITAAVEQDVPRALDGRRFTVAPGVVMEVVS